MSQAEHYPKTKRNDTERLRTVLSMIPGLSPEECKEYAIVINDMADKAVDLNEIFGQLGRTKGAEDLAEWLTAFALTVEQLRGGSDAFAKGKLYELSDRLRQHGIAKRA